jgi:hypothetical protein
MSVKIFLVFALLCSSTTVELNQTEDVDVIFLIHFIFFISFSILSVISESISFGFTHGYGVVIVIIPNFISGLDSFGIVKRENIPATMIKNITKKEILYFFTQNQKNHFNSLLEFCIFFIYKFVSEQV